MMAFTPISFPGEEEEQEEQGFVPVPFPGQEEEEQLGFEPIAFPEEEEPRPIQPADIPTPPLPPTFLPGTPFPRQAGADAMRFLFPPTKGERVRNIAQIVEWFAPPPLPEDAPTTMAEAMAGSSMAPATRIVSGAYGGGKIGERITGREEFAEAWKESPVLETASLGLDIVDVLPLPLAAWGLIRKARVPGAVAAMAEEGFETMARPAAQAARQAELGLEPRVLSDISRWRAPSETVEEFLLPGYGKSFDKIGATITDPSTNRNIGEVLATRIPAEDAAQLVGKAEETVIVEFIEHAPGEDFTRQGIRHIASELRDIWPDAKIIGGQRLTGARAAAGADPLAFKELERAARSMKIGDDLVRQTTPGRVAAVAKEIDEVPAPQVVNDLVENTTRLGQEQMQLPGMETVALRNGSEAASRGIVDVPSIPTAGVASDEAAEAVIRGALDTPAGALPVSNVGLQSQDTYLEAMKIKLSSMMAARGMSASEKALFHRTFHGGTKMMDDYVMLKRQIEYMAEVGAGRQHVPMTMKEARQVRKQWGPRALKEPSGKRIISRLATPRAGEDVMEFAFRPYAMQLQDAQDIGLVQKMLGQFHKGAPEADRVLRPAMEGMYRELADIAKKWNGIQSRFGITPGSDSSVRISELLDGRAGDIKQYVQTTSAEGRVIPGRKVLTEIEETRPVAGAPEYSIVQQRRVPTDQAVPFQESIVLDDAGLPIMKPTAMHAAPAQYTNEEILVAALARKDLDDLWVRLNQVIPEGLAYNNRYITYIRDQYQKGGMLDAEGNVLTNLTPPDIIRNTGRSWWFNFTRRTDNNAPADLDFVRSMQAYLPAAVRKIHMDPAIAELGNVRRMLEKAQGVRGTGVGNKISLIDKATDYLLGAPAGVERDLDRFITRIVSLPMVNSALQTPAAQKIPMVRAMTSRRPSMRMSIQISSGTYRGILGGNISASLNNMTQTMSTMAKEGVWPTMRGIRAMTTKEGIAVAQKARLQNEFFKVFEEIQPGLVRISGGKWKNVDDVLFAPFEFAEHMNRGIAFHTGYQKAIRAGASVDDAIRAGRAVSNETQFVYDAMSKNMHLRGPLARQFGVLTSFPVKQTEFLAGMLKRDQLALARYFLVVGFLQKATNAAGVTMEPFEGVSVGGMTGPPGTAYLRQVEGAVTGRDDQGIMDVAPFPGLVKQGTTALMGYLNLNPTVDDVRKQNQRVNDFLSSLLNIVMPASVQIQEGFRVYGNIKQIRETQEEPGELGEVSRPLGITPMLRDITGPRSGKLSRRSTPGEEIARALGLTPLRQKEQQKSFQALSAFVGRGRGERSMANEAALFWLQQGDKERARQILTGAGVTGESFRSFRQGAGKEPLVRMYLGLSARERQDFREMYPDEAEIIDRMVREERISRQR